ncbi:MAG TPA: gluconeogenesis factor YvcK family protein, partial [Bacillota bacterium]|nr:gluconeogenesis factor YvcK family protein [Bacillota bacterium]
DGLSKGDFRQRNTRSRGPKIVVVGGGTGLGTILRGLKEISSNLTAIVTVADDGGSSGRLRNEFGILPPGDIRNCLVAMADLEPLMERLMQYRFQGDSDLGGHNFGNLFLTALTGITGDFEAAIKESSKVLAVRGQVLPATLEHVVLQAELEDGTLVTGESQISKSQVPIHRVALQPGNVRPVAEAITAISEADIILLGPGSLFTSIIPNLLVAEITDAIKATKATKVYICNAMTQPGETDNLTASDHVRKIVQHTGPGLIDIAIVNTDPIPADVLERYAEEHAYPVVADLEKIKAMGITPIGKEIIVKAHVVRHDAGKLANLIEDLIRARKVESIFGKFIARHLLKIIEPISGLF